MLLDSGVPYMCAQPPARAALISFGAIRSDCNTNEWYTGKAPVWAVPLPAVTAAGDWEQCRLQSHCRVTGGGELGFYTGNHPAPPCSPACWQHTAVWWQLVPHWALRSSWSAKGTCCEPGSAAQGPSTHCPRQELTYSLHPAERELSAGGMHRGTVHTQPHPALAALQHQDPTAGAGRKFSLSFHTSKGLVQSCLARHKVTTSQSKNQESVWQLDKMYPRSCRKPIDQD